jgi:AcrR family transcriptional regulator
MATTPRTSASKARKGTAKPAARKPEPSTHLDGGRARDREVIEAAVEIFAEKGYSNASVQDVAERLGMLKGSLYYYINSKESLLRKIFEDSHEEITHITDEVMASDGSGLERLSQFLVDYATWTLTHLKRAGLYSREWRYASEELQTSLVDQQRYYNRSLRSLIVACQSEGSIPSSIDPRMVSLFIWSAFTTLPDWFNPDRDTEAVVAERYVVMALRAAGVSEPSLVPSPHETAPWRKSTANAAKKATKATASRPSKKT